MRAWHFTEMPYPNLPPLESLSTMRVSLPNSLFDPKIGADLYNRYLDEYMIADDLGLDMLCNEHHQTATCIDVCAPLTAAILARQTSNGRICILGNPIRWMNPSILKASSHIVALSISGRAPIRRPIRQSGSRARLISIILSARQPAASFSRLSCSHTPR